MPNSLEDLARLMSNVTLTQPSHISARNEKDEQESALFDGIQKLASVTSKLGTEVDQAQVVNHDGDTLLSCRIAAIGSVLKRSAEITRIVHDLENATVRYIMSRLMSFCGGNPDVRTLLLHFESEVRTVIKETYKDAEWEQDSMVRILEACYVQALSGNLHVDNYFAPLYEANPVSPYDPDFDSEAYYDHEDRLQIDEDYAEAESMRKQRKSEERDENEMRTHRAWVEFWVRMLHGCQGGPTLFWPYPDDTEFEDLPEIPRYLFRAFDAASSGKSDETVVASSASIHQKKTSRTDLLSLEIEGRAEKLYAHLKKKCFGDADHADNLMSWSSSMLFVLQYAIWRCSTSHRSPGDTYICVVDTARFPRGQFARDTWLLEQCRGSQNASTKIQDEFRLRERGYDNGEYLSQGLLVHRNRSAVATLNDIIKSGLYKLYPEFDDPYGKKKWTNRVRDLRSAWAQDRSTSCEELQRASDIAMACFGELQPRELAICLLTLKNLRLKSGLSTGMIPVIGR